MTSAAFAKRAPLLTESLDMAETLEIGGIAVSIASAEAAAESLSARLDAGIMTKVAFLNAHCVNLSYESGAYRSALAGFTVLPDGIGIDIGARVVFGRSFPENLNGTDFVPFLLRSLVRPMRVALIGAKPGVAEKAAAQLAKAMPRHVFVAISNGYFAEGAETEAVLARLRAAKADIVLVALGVPRQELFIARHVTPGEATVAIAVGALFDFLAGNVPRAPPLVRRLRLEWIYRLAVEPRRLWRRYIVGNPIFLLRMLAERRRLPGRTDP